MNVPDVIPELKRIGITKKFIDRLASGEADADAYAPAGKLFSRIIAKVWNWQDSQSQSD